MVVVEDQGARNFASSRRRVARSITVLHAATTDDDDDGYNGAFNASPLNYGDYGDYS